MPEYKQIGKLKAGKKFKYYGENQEWVITQSGFGRPLVHFSKVEDKSKRETFFESNKRCVVEIVA